VGLKDVLLAPSFDSVVSECGEETGDENGENDELDPWLLFTG
jgi:hypothetical protein